MVQAPGNERRGGNACEDYDCPKWRQLIEHDKHGQSETRDQQDDGRMAQPFRPRRKEGS